MQGPCLQALSLWAPSFMFSARENKGHAVQPRLAPSCLSRALQGLCLQAPSFSAPCFTFCALCVDSTTTTANITAIPTNTATITTSVCDIHPGVVLCKIRVFKLRPCELLPSRAALWRTGTMPFSSGSRLAVGAVPCKVRAFRLRPFELRAASA